MSGDSMIATRPVPAVGAVCLSAPDCVKILDQFGMIQFFNEDGLRIMEIDDFDRIKGRYWPDLWPEQSRAMLENALEAARSNGVATFVAECPTAKGTDKLWEVTIASIPAPSGHYAVISRDVTDRRAREVSSATNQQRIEMALTGSGSVGLWDWMVDSDLLHGDPSFARMYGLDIGQTAAGLTMAQFQEFVVAEDIAPLREKIREVFESNADFLVEYRLDVPGQPLRWVLCKGRMHMDSASKPYRFSGTAIDITDRKLGEQQKQLLMEELSHRMKNSFAIVQAIAGQTFGKSDEGLLSTFQNRLATLGKAHDLLLQSSWSSTRLIALIGQALSVEADPGRFDLSGPDLEIGSDAALSLSLLLHEMATNAVKYGALSVEKGRVRLEWRSQGDEFVLDWRESGGPEVSEPTTKGFGSRLIAMGICNARNSRIDHDRAGLSAQFRAPLATLRGQ